MGKKQYFAILDTETTMENTVADFAIIIVDRQGKIYNQCAVLVKGHYGTYELFHDKNANDIWGYNGLIKRQKGYIEMLNNGQRMLASVNAINKWIMQAVAKYNPTLTAYNLAFDLDKCNKTAIDLTLFQDQFCLWQAANPIYTSKGYKQFAIENHLFTNRTELGNMTIKTNAEAVCGYITSNLIDEPHTALEDARDFELPILTKVVNSNKWREKVKGYNWREHQVKDHYKVK